MSEKTNTGKSSPAAATGEIDNDRIGTAKVPKAGAPPFDNPTQLAATTANVQNAIPSKSVAFQNGNHGRSDAPTRTLYDHIRVKDTQTIPYKQWAITRCTAAALRDGWQRIRHSAIK